MKDDIYIYDVLFRVVETRGKDCAGIQLSCGDNSHPMSYLQVSIPLLLSDNSYPMPKFQVGSQLSCGDHSHPMPYIQVGFQLLCSDHSHPMPYIQLVFQLCRQLPPNAIISGKCSIISQLSLSVRQQNWSSVLTGCQQKSTTTRACKT